MIAQNLTCRKCGSEKLIKNGTNGAGNPKSKCKNCGFSGAINPKRVDESTKELIVKAYQERASLRGVARIFGVSHGSVLNWVKKKQ